MIQKKIILAQTTEELEYILQKLNNTKNIFCVPLNLDTQLYCLENKINFFNPLYYLKSDFHKVSLIESEKMLKKLVFDKNYTLSEMISIKAFLRFHFNSVVFLIELINKISKKESIDKIIVSGWNNYKNTYAKKNYFVSNLVKSLFNKRTIVLRKINISKIKDQSSTYQINFKNLTKKKIIIFTNLGYNIFRIIKVLKQKTNNSIFLTPKIEKLSIAKKILFKFFNIYFFDFEKINSNKKSYLKLPVVKYCYKKRFNLTEILNRRINQESWQISQNKNKLIAIRKFFLKHKPSLVISNNSRDLDGKFLDIAHAKNIPLMCVPHGTITPYFNRYDKIYKKIIADSITYSGSNFISQSKISNSYYKKEKKEYKKIIQSGNILFSENKNLKSKNKKILYAVTSKDFQNIQYLGVEMYYEYLDNLNFLNNFSKKNDLEIFVKNHPTISKFTELLQKRFTNLLFTDLKIQKILSKTSLTISFSSSVIEDSLHCHNPIILLDRWKRYKHCNAELNPNRKNRSIYYINNDDSLIKCINTIFNSKSYNFKKYISKSSSKANIKKVFSQYY